MLFVKKGLEVMKKKQTSEVSYGVIGLGRFGTALAMTLAKADKEVIVIDRDESKIKEIRQYTEYAFVSDNLSIETLREIGIQNCDVVIVCIGEKVDVSILTTMSVLELGVPRVIAKAISQEQGAVLRRSGRRWYIRRWIWRCAWARSCCPRASSITSPWMTAWRSGSSRFLPCGGTQH